jgi:hypothetical protein
MSRQPITHEARKLRYSTRMSTQARDLALLQPIGYGPVWRLRPRAHVNSVAGRKPRSPTVRQAGIYWQPFSNNVFPRTLQSAHSGLPGVWHPLNQPPRLAEWSHGHGSHLSVPRAGSPDCPGWAELSFHANCKRALRWLWYGLPGFEPRSLRLRGRHSKHLLVFRARSRSLLSGFRLNHHKMPCDYLHFTAGPLS